MSEQITSLDEIYPELTSVSARELAYYRDTGRLGLRLLAHNRIVKQAEQSSPEEDLPID